MKTCEICKDKEATVHLTQVVDGVVRKLHFCEECAEKRGIDIHGPVSINDLLLGMGVVKKDDIVTGHERSCPRCHMRRTDFKKTGRFGCATCYESFAEELPPLLKAMHHSEHHSGKVPQSEATRVRASQELDRLEAELRKAVEAEQFEDAARLRDRIVICKAQLAAVRGPT